MTGDEIKYINVLLYELDKVRLSNPSKTISLAEETLQLSEKIGYELGIAVSYLRIADAKADLGEIETSLVMIFKALDFFIKDGYYDLQWHVYNSLGVTFSIICDYDSSINYYYKAESVIHKINSSKSFLKDFSAEKAKVLTLNNISENYKLLKEYDIALNYCKKAYEIDNETDFALSRGITPLSLGELYYNLSEYEKANSLGICALKYLKYYNYYIAEAETYELLALTSWKLKNFDSSDKYYNLIMQMLENNQIPVYNEVNIFINYYFYLEDQGHASEAVTALKHACTLSVKNNLHSKICEVSGLLAAFYEKTGDTHLAFNYYKMHYEFDVLRLKSFNEQIAKNFNIKKKVHEFKSEKKKIVQNNENLKKESEALKLVVQNISIISELGQKITATLDLNSIKALLYSSIRSFMDISYFFVCLYDDKTDSFVYIDAFLNGKKIKLPNIPLSSKNIISAICLKTSKVVIINDFKNDYSKYIDYNTYQLYIHENPNLEINSLIYCPLIINSDPIGVLSVQSNYKNAFTPYQIEMVKSLSAYAAIAINNALKSLELENLNRKLLELSENDSLTRIYNRRKFDKYLDEVWNNAILNKENISLLLIDIDYFKEYNDNYGHLEGDKCIIEVAKILESCENKKYFTARYGGDEFIILLPGCSLEEALLFSESIQLEIAALNIKHEYSKISTRVTLSIGAASTVPYAGSNSNSLIKTTDNALYIAKKQGKNQVAYIKN